jgi:isocitrate dehydrogenase
MLDPIGSSEAARRIERAISAAVEQRWVSCDFERRRSVASYAACCELGGAVINNTD